MTTIRHAAYETGPQQHQPFGQQRLELPSGQQEKVLVSAVRLHLFRHAAYETAQERPDRGYYLQIPQDFSRAVPPGETVINKEHCRSCCRQDQMDLQKSGMPHPQSLAFYQTDKASHTVSAPFLLYQILDMAHKTPNQTIVTRIPGRMEDGSVIPGK